MSLIATQTRRIVVGLGQTGLSCARFLAAQGLPFAVADSREQPPGLQDFRRDFPDVELVLGTFALDQFTAADELFVSPGISLREPAIANAISSGVRVSGDLDLFVAHARAPIAAITGSNGKSTVTTLLGEMAQRAGTDVAIGGNLGTPMLELLDRGADLYVLELSSFQLERCAAVNAEVATVLNVSEDHLDHHGSLLEYHQAKHRIFRGCRQAVVNRDDALSQPLVPDSVKLWSFGLGRPDINGFGLTTEEGEDYLVQGSERLLAVGEMRLCGRHNVANALAALALGTALGLERAAMLDTLREFPGLPHRCQFVDRIGGVDFYDDSKGTNVGAAIASLHGVGENRRVVLIAGGQAKGGGFDKLIEALLDVGRGAVFIGEAARELDAVLDQRLPSQLADDMAVAVRSAYAMARENDAVLLSPGCASFDMFANYQHRGQCFQAAVAELAAGGAS